MGTANKRRKTPRRAVVAPPTPFARKLRDLREARGMTLAVVEQKVAQELGVKEIAPSRERIRRAEVGLISEDMLETDVLVALAEVYGVSAADISPSQFRRASLAHDLFDRHVRRVKRSRKAQSNTGRAEGSDESPPDPHFMEKWELGCTHAVPATG